jgi:outer membrane lipoprotein carrier protein
MKKYLALILALLMMLSTSLLAIDAAEVIKKAKQTYEATPAFSAEFAQQFKWKLAGDSQEQQGKIWMKSGDKFKIETPDQTIVSDGKTIWTYSRANNQVIIDNMKSSSENQLPNDIFLKYTQEYRPVSMSEEMVDAIPCYTVLLVPKTENAFIREMKVWVDKKQWLTVKIQHVDINENTTTYLLSNITIDKTLPDDTFNFKKSTGVEEVDMR